MNPHLQCRELASVDCWWRLASGVCCYAETAFTETRLRNIGLCTYDQTSYFPLIHGICLNRYFDFNDNSSCKNSTGNKKENVIKPIFIVGNSKHV